MGETGRRSQGAHEPDPPYLGRGRFLPESSQRPPFPLSPQAGGGSREMGRGLHPRAAGTYPLGEGTEATAVPAEDLLTLAAGVPSGAARAQLEGRREMGRGQYPAARGQTRPCHWKEKGLRLWPPLLRTLPFPCLRVLPPRQSVPGRATQAGRGSRRLASASRRRGALRCRGGWHRLAAPGLVPRLQGEGASASDRQPSALRARPLACQLQPRPRSGLLSLRSGQCNCWGRTTRAQG